MRVNRSVWSASSGWMHEDGGAAANDVDLALVFGSTAPMIEGRLREIRQRYPNAYVCGGSTAGEIVGKEVRDDSVVVTAIDLEKTELHAAEVTVASADESLAAGRKLAAAIPHAGLVHTFVLADGLAVNGSELVKGSPPGSPRASPSRADARATASASPTPSSAPATPWPSAASC